MDDDDDTQRCVNMVGYLLLTFLALLVGTLGGAAVFMLAR